MRNLIIVALVTLAACDSKPDASPISTPAQIQAVKSASAKPPTPPKVDLVEFAGTPHDEEFASVTLTWTGSSSKVDLVTKTGAAAGFFQVEKGARIGIKASITRVVEPNVVTAGKGAKLFDASVHNLKTNTTAEASRVIEVTAGDKVDVLKYVGEGTCYVRYAQEVYYAGCPSREKFKGDFTKNGPAKSEWWIQPTGQSGWLLVDDRIKVDVATEY